MRIQKNSAADLGSAEICATLGVAPTVVEDLKARVEREFGHVPVVREHVWAEPTWIFLGIEGDEIVSFLNIIDRQVTADGTSVHFFGLNNVITEPPHRGKGYSTALNHAAIEFMFEQDKDAYGFLFCADDLIPHYTKLGWLKFNGEVIVLQPSGDKRWESNAMIYASAQSSDRKPDWESVHLCGLPW